jgi:PiT family inorganic phosphate transporter
VSLAFVAGIGIFLAFVNGANDVSKGIATLAGSGVTNLRRAVLWGAGWTTAGSLAAYQLSGAMMSTFGKGLLSTGINPRLSAALAIVLGASMWVALATRLALPVSTTHAIVGSIMGVATAAYGFAGMNWRVLGMKVVIPLLVSPIISTVLVIVILKLSRPNALASEDCVCAEIIPAPTALTTASCSVEAPATALPALRITECQSKDLGSIHPNALPLTLDHLHWVTSGSVSFVRGLNDAPKIAALFLGVTTLAGHIGTLSLPTFILVSLGILIGSLVAGRRVTQAMAEKITAIDHQDGFLANLITALLVGPGAALGLPMSTTHVASGAIIGVGLNQHGRVNWTMVRNMALAWVVTLPAAALLGIVGYELLRLAGVA